MEPYEFRAWNLKTNEMLPHRTPSGKLYAIEALQYPHIYHLMIYIGTKDIHDRKCFKDDIIKIDGKVLRVGWCEQCGGYRGIDKDGKTQANPYSEEFEIWGNIYQHTEITLS